MTDPWKEVTEYGDEAAELPDEVLLVAQATATPNGSDVSASSSAKKIPINLIYASSSQARKLGSDHFKNILPRLIKDTLETHLSTHKFQVDFLNGVENAPADSDKTVFAYLVFGSATAIEIARNRFSNFEGSTTESRLATYLTNGASAMLDDIGQKGRYCFCNFEIYDEEASILFSEIANKEEKAVELFSSLVLHEIGHCFGASHDNSKKNIMNDKSPANLSDTPVLNFNNNAVVEMEAFLSGWP